MTLFYPQKAHLLLKILSQLFSTKILPNFTGLTLSNSRKMDERNKTKYLYSVNNINNCHSLKKIVVM